MLPLGGNGLSVSRAAAHASHFLRVGCLFEPIKTEGPFLHIFSRGAGKHRSCLRDSAAVDKETNQVADSLLFFRQASRALKQRLQLAQFKAENGWQHETIDQIQPKVEQRAAEASRKRRAEQAEVVSSSSSLNPNGYKRQALGNRVSFDEDSAVDDSMSAYAQDPLLYSHHLSPYYGTNAYSSYAGTFHDGFSQYINAAASPPRQRNKTPLSATHSEHLVHPASPVSSARDESPFDARSRPSSAAAATVQHPHRRYGSMPAISTVHAQALQRGSFSPRQNPRCSSSLKPISSTDADFAGSAKEFVSAASALTGMTRSESTEPVSAPSSKTDFIDKSSTPKATSIPAFQRALKASNAKKPENEEEGAELMLLFAGSPSPASKSAKRQAQEKPGEPVSQMKGRALFADSETSDTTSTGSDLYGDLLQHHSEDDLLPSNSVGNCQSAFSEPHPQSAPATITSYLDSNSMSIGEFEPNYGPRAPTSSFGLSKPAPIQTSSSFDVGSFFDQPRSAPFHAASALDSWA